MAGRHTGQGDLIGATGVSLQHGRFWSFASYSRPPLSIKFFAYLRELNKSCWWRDSSPTLDSRQREGRAGPPGQALLSRRFKTTLGGDIGFALVLGPYRRRLHRIPATGNGDHQNPLALVTYEDIRRSQLSGPTSTEFCYSCPRRNHAPAYLRLIAARPFYLYTQVRPRRGSRPSLRLDATCLHHRGVNSSPWL